MRRRSKHADHHRRLRHRGRHPGAAQLRRRARISPPIVYAQPDYIQTLATSTPIADHVPVDFELRGCPINKHQLVEVISRLPRRPPAGDAAAQRLRRVQAQGQCLRDGGARHALPGAGHPCRLRRAVPVLQPRLLRLLRADGDAERAVAQRPSSRALGMDERGARARLPHASTPTPSRSARRASAMARKTIKVDYLARVEGEGALQGRRARRRGDERRAAASSSRRASSRRSCAAAPSPRRPTSPRASAASARSPIR